jgi:alpha-glucosidase
MLDFGYDIADFCDIDPVFGNLSQFNQLLDELHARGIRLILDFVPNHTSSQHPWFIDSRSSRSSAKRDWYVWVNPGPDGSPPNNWLSRFGGSAWQWDEQTKQYYYHAFLAEQPDLNWRNRGVYDLQREFFSIALLTGAGDRRPTPIVLSPESRSSPALVGLEGV